MCRRLASGCSPIKQVPQTAKESSSSKRSGSPSTMNDTNNQVNGQIQGGENGILVAQMNNHVEGLPPAVLPIAQINTEASMARAGGRATSNRACNPCATRKQKCPRVDGDQICNSCVRRELSCYWPCRRCRRINKKCDRSDEIITCRNCTESDTICVLTLFTNDDVEGQA